MNDADFLIHVVLFTAIWVTIIVATDAIIKEIKNAKSN